MWKLLLLAGIGGFIGTCCRFLVNRLYLVIWKTSFPLATFTINILGCFLIGLLIGFLGKNGIINPKWNALLVVGFCGGFTTFSTFSLETFNLASNGEILSSFLYVIASVVAGFLAVWFGLTLVR